MTVEVRCVPALTDEERRTFFGWGRNIFGADDPHLKMRKARWHVVIYEDDRPVCQMGIYPTTVKVGVRGLGIHQWRPRRLARWIFKLVNLNTRSVRVAGAGGLVVPPSEQGLGYASMAGKYGIEFARDELHADFGLLFSVRRLQALHTRYWGAKVIQSPVYFDQPSGKVLCPLIPMSISLTGKEWPSGIVDIDGLPW
jgi:hypothetical protein